MNTTVDNLLQKAKTIEKREIFKERLPELSEDQKQAAEMIGLDLAKLKGTKRAVREMGEVENPVEQFIEFLPSATSRQ